MLRNFNRTHNEKLFCVQWVYGRSLCMCVHVCIIYLSVCALVHARVYDIPFCMSHSMRSCVRMREPPLYVSLYMYFPCISLYLYLCVFQLPVHLFIRLFLRVRMCVLATCISPCTSFCMCTYVCLRNCPITTTAV